MSLVAYASSSDEEDEKIEDVTKKLNYNKSELHEKHNLPESNEFESNISASLLKLPLPKTNQSSSIQSNVFTEEDDEFLHKKEIIDKKSKKPVQISIPTLAQFKNVDDKKKAKSTLGAPNKLCGLLNILPKPKNEQHFTPANSSKNSGQPISKKVVSLIPDSVKNRQLNKNLSKPNSVVASDSDDDDENSNSQDFFLLNAENKLPEVSASEIDAMVAKRAAKMAETSKQFEKMSKKQEDEIVIGPQYSNDTQYVEQVEFDDTAIQHLVGRQAKRKKFAENIQVTELSSSQVMPNKDDWLRSALASETGYQMKGVLVDEEPAPGTRKKHQITYLAHQAKANEAELQAMWATNRQTRRATANKYGF